MKFYYGVTHLGTLEAAFKLVSDVFPASNRKNTLGMLYGTAITETLLGTYVDAHPLRHGIGIMQMDKIAFDDIKTRTRPASRDTCTHRLDVDFEKVEHTDLAYEPLLSVLFARLFYKLIPETFPEIGDLKAQGAYWKKYYNTSAGKGTVEEFVTKNEDFIATLEKWGEQSTKLKNVKE
jgi:hypothetical protein